MFSLCVERDVLPADRAKYKREREVKPGGAGYRGMRIVVVRYIYDINESTINFIWKINTGSGEALKQVFTKNYRYVRLDDGDTFWEMRHANMYLYKLR